jgi:hypothetical protein
MRDGQLDDRVVSIGEIGHPIGCDEGRLCLVEDEFPRRDGHDMRDRQDPPTIVAIHLVEDVKLARVETGDSDLVAQRPGDGLGKPLAFMEEGAGEAVAAADGRFVTGSRADEHDAQWSSVGHGEYRGVDRDGRSRIVGQGSAVGIGRGSISAISL